MAGRENALLIVLADGEHARFVRLAADNALHTYSTLKSGSAHKRSSGLGTDAPGASFHSGSSAHHGLSPRQELSTLEREKFGRDVAERFCAEARVHPCDRLVVVAPPHILADILTHVDDAVDARIVGTLRKDLLKTPDNELQPHLREWVRPVRRAR